MENTDYQNENNDIVSQYREKARLHFKDAIDHLNEDSKYKSEISLAQKEIDDLLNSAKRFGKDKVM